LTLIEQVAQNDWLMELKAYMKSLKRKARADFFERLSCHPLYLYSISSRRRRPGPQLAREIVAASGGKVRLYDLRPDIWPPPSKAAATDPACIA
jgi:hypothetical protein